MIIKNARLQMKVLHALSDEHMSKILESTSVSEKSVNQIMKEYDLPHSTTYRKLKLLIKSGLLALYRIEIINGKKIGYYKSTFRSLTIDYSGTSYYKIYGIANPDVLEKFSLRFYDMEHDE